MPIHLLIRLLVVTVYLGLLGCAQNSGSSPQEAPSLPQQTDGQDNSLNPPTIENPTNDITGTWLNDSAGKYAKYKISIGPKFSRFSTVCLFEKESELEASVKFYTELDANLLFVRGGSDTKYDNNRTCRMQLNRGTYAYRVLGNRLELTLLNNSRGDVFSSRDYRKIE